MIGVCAKASVTPEGIDAFEKSAQNLVKITRAQDAGCLSYNFGPLVEEGAEGEYAFLERWESQKALDAHLATEHFSRAKAEWETYLAEPLEIYTYQI